MTDKEVAQWMAEKGIVPVVEKYNAVNEKMAKDIDYIDKMNYGDNKK